MSKENEMAIDAIIKGISDLFRHTEKLPVTKLFSSPIYGIDHEKNTYTIVKDKNSYEVKNGLPVPLSLGQNVWVIIPDGCMRNMFICALKT